MRILLIEDDAQFNRILTMQLEQNGYTVDLCEDGQDAFDYIEQTAYDIILLDRMLPHVDGLAILKKIRQHGIHTPVLLLTALGELSDRITGLDAGADDYLVKPFETGELLARIRCISRRPRQWEEGDALSLADISYLTSTHILNGSLGKCTLSKKEGQLMEFFLRNPGQILPRQTILSHVWGTQDCVEEGNLDNYIHFIRRRIKSVSSFVRIETIRGVGYCMREN